MNAAAGRLAALDTVPSGYVWYWGCGLGFTLLFATLIAMLHKDLRSWKASRIPRSVRLAVPLACALSLILAPLAAERVSPMGWLGIGASLVWTIVMVETVGSLPTKWALKEGSC
jgi:hypothetical protein